MGLMDAIHEKTGEDVFVASHMVVGEIEPVPFSYAHLVPAARHVTRGGGTSCVR